MVILLYVKILLDLLYWEQIPLYEIMFLYYMLKMENAFLIINTRVTSIIECGEQTPTKFGQFHDFTWKIFSCCLCM